MRALEEITETDLPGIGKKFTLTTVGGATVTVISHLTGRRDIYHAVDEDSEPALITLTDEESRRLSAVLGDTFFKPTPIDMLQSALASRANIEVVRVPAGSPAVGGSLKELDIRRLTGASVLAIQRGDETTANPPPAAKLQEGDVLIALGATEQIKKLEKLLQKG